MRRGVTFLILCSFCFLSIAGTLFASPPPPGKTERKCDDGKDNDGDELIDCLDLDCAGKANCPGGGGPNPVFVDIEIDFGGAITTLVNVDALITCDAARCDLTANLDGRGDELHLPDVVVPILNQVEIRKIELDGDVCFGTSLNGVNDPPEFPLKTEDLAGIQMFIPLTEDNFVVSVGGFACDMDSLPGVCSVRKYEYRFLGLCPALGCNALPPPAMGASTYVGNWDATWSPGPDSKKGIPCRCTRSTKPPCPEDAAAAAEGVAVVPAATITVTLH